MANPKSLFASNGNVIVDNSAGVRVLAGPKADMKDYTEEFNNQIARNGCAHIDGGTLASGGHHESWSGLLWRHPDIGRVKVTSFSWMCDGCHASLESNICDYCGNEFLEDAWRQ